jgi:cytochrome c oxidase assembly protein subunit 11
MSQHQDTDDSPAGRPVEESLNDQNKRFGKKLLLIIVGSFAFAWASIPLYRVVCAKIDPGGSSWFSTSVADETYEDVEVDESRTIRVSFTTEVNSRLPWKFERTDPSVEIHPGEKTLTKFIAKNLDQNQDVVGQAVYDINPPQAAAHFRKIECFCFTEQPLAAGEEAEMPLYFWFDPDLPEDITDIKIAYTFFNLDSSRTGAR